MILADHNVFLINAPLWMDSLYFRLTSPRSTYFTSFLKFQPSGYTSELFMSQVTMQGNGAGVLQALCVDCGLEAWAPVHVEGAM